MQEYKIDLRTDIARHYFFDASDFLSRFNLLLEDYSKTKRTKCFVDLLMGFECILKSHIVLSHPSNDMVEVYKVVRSAGHNLVKLSDLAKYSKNRDPYEKVKRELGQFSVFIRYSIDAYENFFPSFIPRGDSNFDYSSTLTNHPWLIEMRDLLKILISETNKEFCGEVTMDIGQILDTEQQMRDFAIKVGIIKS